MRRWNFQLRRILFRDRPASNCKPCSDGLKRTCHGETAVRAKQNAGLLKKFPWNLCFSPL